jgi:aspartyl-tRNA synthetase
MVSGMDRYFQVARCFRDEDLRADRQPEFTQLDMEMSFVEEEDIFAAWEGVLSETFRDSMGTEIPTPFPRMTWREAMERFGSDKPDTRFGMELIDARPWVPHSGFGVFESIVEGGGSVMGLTVKGGSTAISRGNIKKLEEVVKTYGGKGMAWWKPGLEGGAAGSIVKFCQGESGDKLKEVMGAEDGDLLVFVADQEPVCWSSTTRTRAARVRGTSSGSRTSRCSSGTRSPPTAASPAMCPSTTRSRPRTTGSWPVTPQSWEAAPTTSC